MMKFNLFVLLVFSLIYTLPGGSVTDFEHDTIKTTQGDLIITFIGHGTLMFQFNNQVIHIDPVSDFAEYSQMPKADLILVTHHHGDHLDLKAISLISTEKTKVVVSKSCTEKFKGGHIMKNGDESILRGLHITAVPAYNLVHKRKDGTPFHPKGVGNGYVVTFGDKKVYIAGDTENFPEMEELPDIDIAFLPMNLPYTMTPEMIADAVNMINPGILYPYHFGETNTGELVELLKDKKDVDVRLRMMK